MKSPRDSYHNTEQLFFIYCYIIAKIVCPFLLYLSNTNFFNVQGHRERTTFLEYFQVGQKYLCAMKLHSIVMQELHCK